MNNREDELIELARKYVAEAEADSLKNPATDEIQIVVVEPNKKPYKKIMKNDLKAMNEIVGGYIEVINIGTTKSGGRVAITLNEEGKLMGLPVNRAIVGFDILVGTFFITAYNMEGDNISLTDQEANYYIKRFTPVEVYL
ncbi:DUF3846 domain-containing protein [Bacillus sp. ISL-75]|uniref:DUF3846 domain-containing protein n=1 Tax=Bacillus sp. ISL-75 TaxID=2819137 RepID=UPI001BE4E42C|nr:DUF3846 domain-containing protein [Bacillus sp. ISL-75]MBT2728415.1 DUF3846 domain-containing protein [Bacillus sp. ISL-75]